MLVLICSDIYDKHIKFLKENLPADLEILSFNEKDHINKALLNRVEVMISRRDLFPEEYAEISLLKLLQVPIAGYEKFDINRLISRNIFIANNGGTNSLSVAEHTIMLILTLNRKFVWHSDKVITGPWENKKYENRELAGSTVGILGFGNCGQSLAKLLRGFNNTIIYTDLKKFSEQLNRDLCASQVNLEELLKQSDYLSVHLPLTKKTRSIIASDELKLMKKDSVIINTSRGGVVDETALFNSLVKKEIRGAGLDVFSEEPLAKDSPLKNLKNIVLTPHSAPSFESMQRLKELLKENILRIYNGQPPLFQVEPYL